MDLDGDGSTDVLSGSWPGELYFFRRTQDGTFAQAEQLQYASGKTINRGHASTVFAVDWDADHDLDLLVGNIYGRVDLVVNQSSDSRLLFGDAVTLVSLEEHQLGDSHPVAADWDGDGDLDLLVGHSEGGVLWCRNTGTRTEADLSAAQELIPNSPSPWASDTRRNTNDWGVRAKICVTDWNRDGRLDILLGDLCGRFSSAPNKTPAELRRERAALEQLPQLRRQWAAAYREYHRLLAAPADHHRDAKLTESLSRMCRLKEEITRGQEVQAEFASQAQSHGFVWLFLRRAQGSTCKP